MDVIGTLTWTALAAWLLLATWWWSGMRRLPRLEVPPEVPPAGGWPRLSLVVAARDEVATIAPALRTWLAQDYPDLEIVIVDDRSSDGTSAAVQAVLTQYDAVSDGRKAGPSVHPLRLEALPDGWLGKTHAQARGAAQAGGEWLLFADADVRMAPQAVRAAIACARSAQADHVALLPRFDTPAEGWRAHLVLAFETAFALLLTVLVRPWLAPDPRSPATLGLGAFGLYRRDAYERAGGHEAVRLRPDDDLALATSVKAAGGRSLVVFAPTLVAVSWYTSLGEALRGLEKNAFAGLRYSLPLVTLVSAGLLATHVLPFAVALFGAGAERAAGLGVVVIVTAVYAWYGGRSGQPAWYALLHPVSVLALVLALLRSTATALVTGRIAWRGTHYALADLRAAQRAAQREPRHEARQSRNSPRT